MIGGLRGKRVLVVEDEFFLADDLAEALCAAGAVIVGPTGSRDDALELLEGDAPDLAVLDINLKGKASFVLADTLAARGIAFVFATGYDAGIIPERHAEVPRWEKPYRVGMLVEALSRMSGG